MAGRWICAWTWAASAVCAAECEDAPFCARIRPGAVFFVGEAVAERERPGHLPEYRFVVREPLLGMPRELADAVIETGEGPPPLGRLLIEVRENGDGAYTRGACNFVEHEAQALNEIALLRRPGVDVSLRVTIPGAAAEERVSVEGPLTRIAESTGPGDWLFPRLPAGRYRLFAGGAAVRELELLPESCVTERYERPQPGLAQVQAQPRGRGNQDRPEPNIGHPHMGRHGATQVRRDEDGAEHGSARKGV